MTTFRLVTDIAAPIDVCFDLSRSIDLHLESMAASQERAVAGVTSGLIAAGEEVTWEARHFGRRWRMTSRITEFDRPHRFVDEMVRGPFVSYHHVHLFHVTDDGARMTDVVTFRAPVGLIANGPLRAYLRLLLRNRNALIRSKAERAAT